MRRARVPAALLAVLGLLAAPLAVEAQSAGKVYRIGFRRAGQPLKTFVEAFQQGLRERGYVDGQNVVIEYRFTGEPVRLNLDVILASGAPTALAAQKATTTVPIVFVGVYDPPTAKRSLPEVRDRMSRPHSRPVRAKMMRMRTIRPTPPPMYGPP
jgi:putative ABC transport system substrate-binding protein